VPSVPDRQTYGLPATEIPQVALRTIWRDRLIVGALNLIAGQPGIGKSSLTALIAAELSRQGKTIILSNCEDDPGSVTVPRLTVAGAILERVHVIPPEDAPLFPREYEGLEHVIERTGTACVIVDPIGAHFKPERRAHDREVLRQLASIGRRTNCAIVAVHHTTKMGEVGGPNSGLRGTARAVYVYGYDPDDEDRRALSVDKINGVAEPPAILFEQEVVEYSVGDTVLEAGKLRKVRQSNARASSRRGRHDPERDAACHAWLSEYLAGADDCARASTDVKNAGREEGFGEQTLRRAKTTLQVEHYRVGGYGANGHWTWRLPDEHPLRTGALAGEEATG
jgi:putative DNA primase/helicase